MAAVIPANAKGTNKGRFCRAKAFIRNTAADRLTASRSAIDKQGNEKKKCVWSRSLQWCFTLRPSSCGIQFKNFLAEALDGAVNPMGQLYGSPTVSGLGSLLFICCSNSKCGETNICRTKKTHRSTRTTRGGPVFDVNTKFAAEFTFCCICKPNKRTYEE